MNRYKKEEQKRGKPFPPGRPITDEEWKAMTEEGNGPGTEDFDDHCSEESSKQKDCERPKEP